MTEDDKVQLQAHLAKGFVKVIFQKANGDIRTMICTTNRGMVPNLLSNATPKTTLEQRIEKNPFYEMELAERREEICNVCEWIVEAMTDEARWRSFRFDSVISFSDMGGKILWQRNKA